MVQHRDMMKEDITEKDTEELQRYADKSGEFDPKRNMLPPGACRAAAMLLGLDLAS